MPIRLVLPLLLSAVPALPAAAASPIAEIVCAPRASLVNRLTVQYGAELRGQGIRDRDSVMEVWSSGTTGAWTLVIAYANGTSCIVAMGEDWADLAPSDPA